jgi:hypothetical protein
VVGSTAVADVGDDVVVVDVVLVDGVVAGAAADVVDDVGVDTRAAATAADFASFAGPPLHAPATKIKVTNPRAVRREDGVRRR